MKRLMKNSQCYALKLCLILLLGIFNLNAALKAQTLCYYTPTTAAEFYQCNENIARTFAPVVMQSVSTNTPKSEYGNADRITGVDFDGNWNSSDNWENIFAATPLNSALPKAYYHVTWTDEFWIVTYTFYWPRDYGNNNWGCNTEHHEGDADKVMVVVKRPENSGTDAADLKLGVIVSRHGKEHGRTCVNDLIPVPDSDPFIGGGNTHTIIGSAPGSHALFNDFTKAYPKEDGGDLNVGQKYCRPDAESRIRYSPGTTAIKNPIPNSGISNERYTLEDATISGGLWDRRCDLITFPAWAKFGCNNHECDDDNAKASAPWNGVRGANPIVLLEDFFDGDPYSVDCDCRNITCEDGNGSTEFEDDNYIFNPYDCVNFYECSQSSPYTIALPIAECLEESYLLVVEGLNSEVSWNLPPALTLQPSYPFDPPGSIRVQLSNGFPFGSYPIEITEEVAPCFSRTTQSVFFGFINTPDPVVENLPFNNYLTYNFGRDDTRFIPSVDINSGGFLRVNDLGQTGYLNEDSDDLPIFEAEIRECSGAANVNINEGGAFILGNDSGGVGDRKAFVSVSNGSTVHVKSGGILRLARGSQLIIEEGATLIIDDGAKVDLWWNTSNIRIKGALIINGDFEFTGSGFFQFDQTNSLTLTDELKLVGQNINHRFIRLNSNTTLNIGSHSLRLSQGTVEYGDGSQIEVWSGGRAYAYQVNFKALESGSSAIGLLMNDPSFVHVALCGFENFLIGIKTNNFHSIDYFKILSSRFIKNTYGIWGDHGDEITIQNTVFDGTDYGLVGVLLSNSNRLNLGQSVFENYESTGISTVGLELDNVVDASVASTTFLNNKNGVKLNDVFNYNMYGGRIEQTTLLSSVSPIGILVPNARLLNDHNYTNIYLSAGAIIKEQEVGISIEKGGPIGGLNGVYGLVSMDCAKLINNKTGIEGVDVSLEIDALVHCNCNLVEDAAPNTFIKGSGPQGGFPKFFDICYEDLNVSEVSAQGNFWSGGNENTLEDCNTNSDVMLINDIQASDEPTRCGPVVINPPKEIKATDRENANSDKLDTSNLTMEVFPNPTDGRFTIALSQGYFRLRIYNSIGALVMEEPSVQGNVSVNLGDFSKGVYFVEALHQFTEKKFQEKLVVQ